VPAPPGEPRSHPPVVRLDGISKRFPGVVANRDVHLSVAAGQVHAVVGENGAGKSTLMKILYGMQLPDEGTIAVDGRTVRFAHPGEAIAAGIGMVHQHFMLADNLTVLENVILGFEPTRYGRLDHRSARARIRTLSTGYGLGVDPDARVEDLGVGDRQRVEILKVLYRGARVLILDEPTAVLVPQEVEALFASLAGLRAEGVAVVFISHKLDEVLRVADVITVLRAGRTVRTVDPGEVTAGQLAELMVGAELPSPQAGEPTVTAEVELTVEHLHVPGQHGRPVVDDVSLTVRRGEVLGVAGVEGNGQAELVEALLGLRRATGRVLLGDRDISGWSTRARRDAGIAFIPADRHRQGLLLSAPLWENRVLGHQGLPPLRRGPWIARRTAATDTARIVREYGLRTPDVGVPAFALSGGNQQKLVVGREMSGSPSLLVASHPTRGVDVGAQAAVWEQLRAARRGGLAVLLISADLEELIGLSDTLVVMLRGRLVATLDPAGATPESLGGAMTGAAA